MATQVERALGEAMREHHRNVGFDHYSSTCGAGCASFVLEHLAGLRDNPQQPGKHGSVIRRMYDLIRPDGRVR